MCSRSAVQAADTAEADDDTPATLQSPVPISTCDDIAQPEDEETDAEDVEQALAALEAIVVSYRSHHSPPPTLGHLLPHHHGMPTTSSRIFFPQPHSAPGSCAC